MLLRLKKWMGVTAGKFVGVLVRNRRNLFFERTEMRSLPGGGKRCQGQTFEENKHLKNKK